MKIQMQGLDVQYHLVYDNPWDECLASLESLSSFDYYAGETLWGLSNDTSISTEGLVWDALKTAKNVAITMPTKAGKTAYREIKKGAADLKNKWTKIKPILLKMIRDMAQNMSIMWSRLMKYDKKYVELGQRIHEVIQSRMHLMKAAPNSTIYWHDFNPYFLKAMVDCISNFEEFWKEIKTNRHYWRGDRFPEPEEIKTLIHEGKQKELEAKLEIVRKGIQNLNVDGEFTILNFKDDRAWYTKFIQNRPHVPFIMKEGNMRNANKKVKTGGMGLAEYVSILLLGPERDMSFQASDLAKFKNTFTGNTGFLTLMSSILNNAVLANALQKGGKSMKKETDAMIHHMDIIIQEAISASKEQEKKEQKEEKERENAVKEAKEDENAIETPDFRDKEAQKEMDEHIGSISTLAEEYANNYTAMIQKAGQTYVAFTRGLLQATFTLVKETYNIVELVESQIETAPKKNG